MSGVTVGDDDHVDFFGAQALRHQELAAGFRSEMRGGDTRIDIMALANSRARANPFVRRLHDLFEIGIRDDARRNIACDTRDFRSDAVGHSVSV